ncbi:hypothetical protein [Streptosporangium sp. NPDC051022]|uniref:hypothetical protein n=1 Tax=Streptosporangium sp. NPDC051022 TaxID=3155752 RepID=UPI00343979AD
MDYKSEVVGGRGDLGVDILARDPRPARGRRVVVTGQEVSEDGWTPGCSVTPRGRQRTQS